MSYSSLETSTDSGEPVELYYFEYNGMSYAYTSSQESITVTKDGISYTFNPDFIQRGDSLKLGSSDGTQETATISVSRTNNVALLYQGAPPEIGSVIISIYRLHRGDTTSFNRILYGCVSQVAFNGSSVELTITIENILGRTIPRGSMSYYCQNSIYDNRCKLLDSAWAKTCYVDGGFNGLWLYSSNLRESPSGYYTDGFIKMGNSYRAVTNHIDNGILIKYPINESDKQGSFTIYPGCNSLFTTCAIKFNNTDNFTGVPYTPPINSIRNRVGKGSYWISDTIVSRDSAGFVGKIAGV